MRPLGSHLAHDGLQGGRHVLIRGLSAVQLMEGQGVAGDLDTHNSTCSHACQIDGHAYHVHSRAALVTLVFDIRACMNVYLTSPHDHTETLDEYATGEAHLSKPHASATGQAAGQAGVPVFKPAGWTASWPTNVLTVRPRGRSTCWLAHRRWHRTEDTGAATLIGGGRWATLMPADGRNSACMCERVGVWVSMWVGQSLTRLSGPGRQR